MSEGSSKEKEFLDFSNVQLSEDNPVDDYVNLIEKKMRHNDIVNDDIIKECFGKISSIVHTYIWRKLFSDEKLSGKKLKLIADLLDEYKRDAVFYNPWDYNEWIVTVRDELLKRNMLDFWLNEMVKRELGPCWARDSDLFDDADDPEPAEFYNYAGGKAPWLQQNSSQKSANEKKSEGDADAAIAALKCPATNMVTTTTTVAAEATTTAAEATTQNDLQYKKISLENPLADYLYNMSIQEEINPNDIEGREKILKEAQQILWQLLFDDATLTEDNYKKAASLLRAIKEDSCLYSPYKYNNWIVMVRNELVNRKYDDFWQNVIVKQKMGLCCYSDSEYFSDAEDEKPLEFYKSFEKILYEKHKS